MISDMLNSPTDGHKEFNYSSISTAARRKDNEYARNVQSRLKQSLLNEHTQKNKPCGCGQNSDSYVDITTTHIQSNALTKNERAPAIGQGTAHNTESARMLPDPRPPVPFGTANDMTANNAFDATANRDIPFPIKSA